MATNSKFGDGVFYNTLNKGFTLIELLAVIVILAIIALIATPVIINIIESARKSAAIDSAYGYIEGVENYLVQKELRNEEKKLIIGENNVKEVTKVITVKGNKPISGIIQINNRNVVTKGINLCISGYSVQYEMGKGAYISGKCNEEEKEIVIKDKKACELETEVIDGNKVYYVDSESDLYELSKEVNNGKNFSGEIIKLRNNLDMSDTSNTCGLETFEPIGTNNNTFSGRFEGNAKTISNLTINKPEQNYVGLFGYNLGTIIGLNLENIDIKGKQYLGVISGYNNGTLREIIVRNSSVLGSGSNVGGITGYAKLPSNISDIILDVNVSSTGRDIFGTVGACANNVVISNIILENGEISSRINNCSNNNVYYSESVKVGTPGMAKKFLKDGINDINVYEMALDTWIGGDDDDSGYYFDYDKEGKVVIKSTEKNPITFNLKGNGTETDPYLISSYQDFKEATTKVDQVGLVFKLTSDIDFTSKKFYMMGSSQNRFSGVLEGNGKTIKNVTIKGGAYLGITGYNLGTIIGLNLENIDIEGTQNLGIISGYNNGTLREIAVRNSSVLGSESYVGGITGYAKSPSNINNIILDVNVSSPERYVFGTIGACANNVSISNIILENGEISSSINNCSNSNVYYSSSVKVKTPGMAKQFSSTYLNDLTYYAGKIETAIDGDANKTDYFFDYGSDGKIYVVKAYSYNPGSVDVDENYTSTYIVEGASDQTAPVCTLDYVVAVPDGIRASFSCTDESATPTITSLFDSTTNKSALAFENIGTTKTGVVNGNKRSVVSTWTTNNTTSKPTKGTCYYFRYGAKDSSGNYSTYITNECYRGFSN